VLHRFVFLALLALAIPAFAGTSGVTYQGRILRPDGSPLSGASTQFKLQIRTPDSQSCLMFEEIQTLNMSNSNGAFSLTLNDGSVGRTDSSGYSLEKIFANQGTLNFVPATCLSGTGTYTPSSTDGRSLVVLFKDETMVSWEPIPPQKINFVPLAFESKQVQGFGADSLLRVVNGSGDPITGLAPLSNAQYTELIALVNGTSTAFTKANQLGGVALPSMTSGEVLGWNGSAWVSQAAVAGANSVTNTMIQNNAVDSTKIASGAVGTSQVAGNVTINTSGTLGAAITTTRDFKIFAASPSLLSIDMQAPALASSYSLVWPMNAGSNGQVLTTDGTGTLSWAPAAASSQWTTQAPGINYMGGNVGIGTTSPAGILDVEGGTAGASTSGASVNIVAQNGGSGGASGGNINLTPGSGTYGGGAGFGSVVIATQGGNASPLRVSQGATGSYTGAGAISTPNSTVSLSNSYIADGNTVFLNFNSRNSSSLGQNAYLGAVTTSGVANYAPAIVIGQQTGASSYAERIRIDSNGNVGIGTTAPSAVLQLKAGTAGASTAPLKFTSGPLMTTPEDGAMEYNSGSGLWFTIGATRYVIPTNTTAGNYSNVSTISNAGGSITMTPSAGNSVVVNSTTVSTSPITGALIVSGGMGVSGAINSSGNILSGGSITATTNGVIPQLYGSTLANGNIKIDGTSNATVGNVYLASAGGNVGIGTTSPSATLGVQGSSWIGESGVNATHRMEHHINGNGTPEVLFTSTSINASFPETRIENFQNSTGNGWPVFVLQNGAGNETTPAGLGAGKYLAEMKFQSNIGGGGFIGTQNPNSSLNATIQALTDTSSDSGKIWIRTNAAGANNPLVRFSIDSVGNIGLGATTPTSRVAIAGGSTQAAWGGNGIGIVQGSSTYTDTTSSGTVASNYANVFLPPTFAASSATTYTTAATQVIYPPRAGTNATLTNAIAMHIPTTSLSASVTNGYGLMVAAPTAAVNNYAASFNGGNVGIGTTAPQAGLDVATTGTASSAIILPRDTTANRPSTPVEGMLRLNSTTRTQESYALGTWGSQVASYGVDLTNISADVNPTVLVTPPINGFYRASCYMTLVTAATTSSTLPASLVNSVGLFSNYGGNIGGVGFTGSTAFYAKAGTNISYLALGYASSGATSMKYTMHFRLERIP
jgi:hypothetical protein